jgi:hypothetical protein
MDCAYTAQKYFRMTCMGRNETNVYEVLWLGARGLLCKFRVQQKYNTVYYGVKKPTTSY